MLLVVVLIEESEQMGILAVSQPQQLLLDRTHTTQTHKPSIHPSIPSLLLMII
jgi:hypothetical protein